MIGKRGHKFIAFRIMKIRVFRRIIRIIVIGILMLPLWATGSNKKLPTQKFIQFLQKTDLLFLWEVKSQTVFSGWIIERGNT